MGLVEAAAAESAGIEAISARHVEEEGMSEVSTDWELDRPDGG